MSNQEWTEYLQKSRLAVQVSLRGAATPQAAVVGIVTTDDFEIFFDTLATSRKAVNLRRDGRTALVVGFSLDDGRTVQVEGVADEPKGEELARLKALYLEHFPDGRLREQWPDITYFRIRPTWIRASDYRGESPNIQEWIPSGSTFDEGRSVLETRLSGAVTVEDVERWKTRLVAEVQRIPTGTRFRLLSDLRNFEPVSIEAHRAMREVVPRLLASHGLRPAVADLFDDASPISITTERGVLCVACANVHHDAEKMDRYEQRVATANQRFFTDRYEAEAWLEQAGAGSGD